MARFIKTFRDTTTYGPVKVLFPGELANQYSFGRAAKLIVYKYGTFRCVRDSTNDTTGMPLQFRV